MTDEKTLQLTTDEISQAALEIASGFGNVVNSTNIPYLDRPNPALRELTHKMILEASNPNGLMIVAKFHDQWCADQIKAGKISWGDEPAALPFTQLPREMQAYAIFYRSAVVSLAQFWAGY